LNGYTYLDNPAKLAGLNESQITRIKDATGQDLIFKNPIKAIKGGGGGIKNKPILLGATEKQILLGVGFSQPDIIAIEKDINQYGLNKVMEGITDQKQKNALQKVYGIKVEEPSKLTRTSISTLYGIPDDDKKTGFLGFGKTNKEKLDDIMKIIAQYQAVGTSDADILKLIKG